jgi:hypothetical protein
MNTHRAAAEALVERTTAGSGVPRSVTDPVVLARIARMVVPHGPAEAKKPLDTPVSNTGGQSMTRDHSARGKRNRACGPSQSPRASIAVDRLELQRQAAVDAGQLDVAAAFERAQQTLVERALSIQVDNGGMERSR